MKTRPLCLLLAALPAAAFAETPAEFSEVVVTAPQMRDPLVIVNDPKAPQVPVPANDGASFLKNIPGFSVTRKGGTDGDPMLRGLAASRLPILLDGMDFHGGCGGRMDPPTAYVFPEAYDRITVVKGPQTVAYGNGNSAGVVLFEHDRSDMRPGKSLNASLMAGSWGRADGVASGKLVTEGMHLEGTLTHAESDDYEDGAGTKVHSAYERQSASLAAGWRPDARTYLGLDVITSKAEAAYADRTMDGVKFDRESVGLTFEKANLSPTVGRLYARIYHSYIDHVMDNYSLRTKASGNYIVNNPDRETDGARISADLNLDARTTLKLGADWRNELHTFRSASNASQAVADSYGVLARVKDFASTTTGVFGELTHRLASEGRIIAGLRHDDWKATRHNNTTGAFIADAGRNLNAWFARYERDVSKAATAYAGLGHNERPMDFWEASSKSGLSATSNLAPEKITQIDAGLLWKNESAKGSVSAFYSRIDDYMLIVGSTAMSKDATRHGAEADLAWKLGSSLTLRGNLAYVRADNNTDGKPLAQTPPLEAKLGLDYRAGAWTFGGLARLVAKQDRFDAGNGTVVGADRAGKTPGFGTLALNASYRPNGKVLVSAGIDNVFDRNYYEHVSKTDSAVTGYLTDTGTAINEPGRFVWVKANLSFD